MHCLQGIRKPLLALALFSSGSLRDVKKSAFFHLKDLVAVGIQITTLHGRFRTTKNAQGTIRMIVVHYFVG